MNNFSFLIIAIPFSNSWRLTILTFRALTISSKASPRQIHVLWLVLSQSGFCSVFLFRSKAGKFNICNQDSEKKVWKLSFFTLKLPAEAKKIELFPKFQRWMKKMNIFLSASHQKCILLSGTECHYNKLLTNRAYCHNLGPIFPSTAMALG